MAETPGFGFIYINLRLYLDPFRPKCQDMFFYVNCWVMLKLTFQAMMKCDK